MAFVVGWKLCFGLGPINLCLLLSFSLLNSCRYGDVIEEDYILYYIILYPRSLSPPFPMEMQYVELLISMVQHKPCVWLGQLFSALFVPFFS